jgi:ABC-type cobalt transport system substrate-binding protein
MKKSGTVHRALGTRKIVTIIFVVAMLIFSSLCFAPCVLCQNNWSGVDETVVEKFAQERGREAREPIINTDQGDLLLFVFLLAGAVGGFAAGYYWRMLLEGKGKKSSLAPDTRV